MCNYVFRPEWDFRGTRMTDLILCSVAGPLIVEIIHSLDTKSREETFLQAAERAMEYMERVMVPGEFIVNPFSSRFVCS